MRVAVAPKRRALARMRRATHTPMSDASAAPAQRAASRSVQVRIRSLRVADVSMPRAIVSACA